MRAQVCQRFSSCKLFNNVVCIFYRNCVFVVSPLLYIICLVIDLIDAVFFWIIFCLIYRILSRGDANMRTKLAALLLSSILLMPAGAWAAFSSLYVFGDSLSDNGTLAASLGFDYLSPYSSVPAQNINRVSNGPVAVEILASQLGLSLNPSLFLSGSAAGTNYAVAGGRAGGTGAIDLVSQINAFNANNPGGAPSDALYVLFMGGNDVRDISDETDNTIAALSITNATLAVETALNGLINSGAQSILVPNVIDIGRIPEAASYSALATQRTMEYNTALAATLAAVEASNGINLFEFDLFEFGESFFADPTFFGLSNTFNTTDACTTGLPVPLFNPGCSITNINEFAFIDDIHPTETLHNIIGNEFLTAIPVPAAFWLFGSGLLGLIGISIRKRAA